jgi:hypothetical protein
MITMVARCENSEKLKTQNWDVFCRFREETKTSEIEGRSEKSAASSAAN